MRVAFGWLSERSGEITSVLQNFLEISRYFVLKSYWNFDFARLLTWKIRLHILHILQNLRNKTLKHLNWKTLTFTKRGTLSKFEWKEFISYVLITLVMKVKTRLEELVDSLG